MRIINPPVRLEHHDYRREADRFVELVAELPGVRAVATVGSVGTPGYSDLDYLVVIDGDFRRADSSKLLHRHPDRDRRIILHGPLVCSEASYSDLFTNLVFDPPTVLAGRLPDSAGTPDPASAGTPDPVSAGTPDPVSAGTPDPVSAGTPDRADPDAARRNRLSNLVDFSETRISQHAVVSQTGVIDQRRAMTSLWSTTHSCHIASTCGLELSDQAHSLVADLQADRDRWRNGGATPEHQFRDLVERNVAVHGELFRTALAAAQQGIETHGEPLDTKLWFTAGSKSVACGPELATPVAVARALRIRGRWVPWSLVLDAPQAFALHLLTYGFESGSAFDRDNGGSVGGAYAEIQDRRARFARRYYTDLAPLGLLSANGPYIVLPPVVAGLARRAVAMAHRTRVAFDRV